MSLVRLAIPTSWGELALAGGSRAGEATFVLLPQLRLALDAGRAHRALPPMSTLFLSHGHLDHAGGIPHWASQRYLNAMGAGTILAPAPVAPLVEELLALCARLEGGRPYEVEVRAVAPGERVPLKSRGVHLEPFSTDHWVPTLGCRLVLTRTRLRRELRDLPQEEIARRRLRGEPVTESLEIPFLSYCADTGPGLFEDNPGVFASEVVLLECSFYRPQDRERAREYGHLHLEDLVRAAPGWTCRHLVVLHPSRRTRIREAAGLLEERLAPVFGGRLHHMMVDWP